MAFKNRDEAMSYQSKMTRIDEIDELVQLMPGTR